MTDPVRGTYHCRSKDEADRWYKFFKTNGYNPEHGVPPASTSVRPFWPVHYDMNPMLPRDTYSSHPGAAHYKRPEYHRHYGRVDAVQPQFHRCAVEVSTDGWVSSQCNNKARYDEDFTGEPTRCKVHSREAQAAKKAKMEEEREARERAYQARQKRSDKKDAALALVILIAAGHNDPREAALALLDEYED